MKLKLKSDRDIHILGVIGDLDAQGFAVLRAGITQLFKSGKNKIILDLSQSKVLRPEPLRELTLLNRLARELAGEILIAGAQPDVAQELQEAAGTEGVVIVSDLASALRRFRPLVQAAAQENEPLVAETSLGAARAAGQESPQPGARLQEEILALKNQLREKESGDLSNLRRENALLKDQNTQLKLLLERQVIERRSPPDESAYQEKIRSLESQVEEALQKLAPPPEARKPV